MNKRALEDSGDDPMPKYRQVLDEARTLKTTNRELKTTNLLLQLMNKQKKNWAISYPKWEVEWDGIHTNSLSFVEVELVKLHTML